MSRFLETKISLSICIFFLFCISIIVFYAFQITNKNIPLEFNSISQFSSEGVQIVSFGITICFFFDIDDEKRLFTLHQANFTKKKVLAAAYFFTFHLHQMKSYFVTKYKMAGLSKRRSKTQQIYDMQTLDRSLFPNLATHKAAST